MTTVEQAERRLETGLYDLAVFAGVCGEVAEELAELVEELTPGLPMVLVRGLVEANDPAPIGAFAAVLDEPFSARRFRDVNLAILAAPELVRRRLARRRSVDWEAKISRRELDASVPCRIANISLGGLAIEVTSLDLTRLAVSDLDTVEISTEEPTIDLDMQARVAYIDPLPGGEARVGLRFLELPGNSANRLQELMAV